MDPSSVVDDLVRLHLWPTFCGLLGLIVGSFLNVCVHRLPRQESLVRPRSRCPACGVPIRALDNVPVLSYLLLRGRCRACRAPISFRYPLVEAVNGAAYFAEAVRSGATPKALVDMALISALIALSLIDLEHFILPNAITRPGIAVGLLASFLPGPPSPIGSAAAAAGGYLGLAALALFYKRVRGIDALGQGDWKMAALLGAFLGWQKMVLILFLASLSGALLGAVLVALGRRGSRDRLPLGTFLGLAGIVVVFVGDAIIDWYKDLLGA